MKVVILEGARGAGKSTIVRKLRDAMINTVAINFTGNKANDKEGMVATYNHFNNFITFLSYETYDGSPFNYLLDRFFFSEMVYSKLYKDYDFTTKYNKLITGLEKLTDKNIEIVVIHLTTSHNDFERNLTREGKAHLFGDDKYADDVHKSIEQDAEYTNLFAELKSRGNKVKVVTADLTNMTLDESVEYVKTLI